MSDTLIGVIIGGIIASITPIITLFINNRRWRYEKRLERLKEERQRREKMYTDTLNKLSQAMAEESYPLDMISDMMILMPKDIFDRFQQWIDEKEKTVSKGKSTVLDVALLMKKHLSEIDKQIEELVAVSVRVRTIQKKLKISLIILLVILIGVCGLLLNNYLSNNNLFLYATGTNDKAFLNSRWKMSPKEIERANSTVLSETTDSFSLLFVPKISDKKRFKEFTQEGLSLWGEEVKVQYSFFDNILYEYYISLNTHNLEETHKEILETLRTKFGTSKEIKEKREDVIYLFEWESDKQKISYWIVKNKEKNNYHVGIRTVYQPFYRQIEELAKKEKQEYF